MKDEPRRAPWLPIDAAWWPLVCASLEKPWPREAVWMDLRWWADQERQGMAKRPGRSALCERWGWHEKRARLTMRCGCWEDQGPARGQRGASEGPVDAISNAENREERASEGPARGQRRAPRARAGVPLPDPQPQPQAQDPQQAPTGALPPAGGDTQPEPKKKTDLKVLWGLLCEARGGRSLTLTPARQRLLKGAVSSIGEDGVLKVATWVAGGQHQRAAFLREGGHDTPDTYLRPSHLGEYLDLAEEERAGPAAEAERLQQSVPYPWVDGMGENLRPSHADRPVMIRAKMLDRKDWYEAHNVTPLHAAVGA